MFTLEVCLSATGLSVAKSGLARRQLNVKSSHRCEALARGLGFGTYASALAAAHAGSPARRADGRAFKEYLRSRSFVVDHQSFYLAIARVALNEVVSRECDLAKHGIGAGRPHRLRGDGWETPEDLQRRFDDERAYLQSDEALEPFLLALSLVGRIKPTRSIRPDTSSYWVKHIAENYRASYPEGGDLGPTYVPNGVLIAAALHAGFTIKRLRDELGNRLQTVHFNMSTKYLDDLNSEIRPYSGRAQDRIRRAEMRRSGISL